jgi:putative tricarboxylic transport membrane protein
VTKPTSTVVEEGEETSPLGDLVIGLVAVGFGVAVLLHVRGFPQLQDGAPGPALFPAILGGLFILFGAVLVVRALRHRRQHRRPEEATAEQPTEAEDVSDTGHLPISTGAAWVNALSVLGMVVLYMLLAETLGFALTMTMLLFALAWRLGAGPLPALLSAIATTAFIYVVFVRVLYVPLPVGVFG